MKELYLYGASGHGKVIAEIAEELDIPVRAFIDNDTSKLKLLDYKVIHELPNTTSLSLVISIGKNKIRKKISQRLQDVVYQMLIHPHTSISKRASIGEGSVIMAGVSINSEAVIGRHAIVNTNASIDHDCVIGDYVHISPHAALAGNVKVGEGTHVGIGASIIQGITVGRWCTIGAGAVVVNDVPDGTTVVGVPAKPIKSHS